MRPMPTRWWLRPVSTHARVGEHSAVVWKFVYCSPPAASRSNVGVAMSLPKQPNCAKPTSSSSTTSTFGDPSGGRTGSGHHGVESRRYRPTTPPNAAHSLIRAGYARGRSSRDPAYGGDVDDLHRDEPERLDDDHAANGQEEPISGERPVDRFRRSATGAAVAAGLLRPRAPPPGPPPTDHRT